MASCALMDGGHGYWRPVNCNAPQPYVCQRPAGGGRSLLPPPDRPAPRSSCPPSWEPYGPDRCLRLTTSTMTWADGRQWCRGQADGADLISVPSPVYQGQSMCYTGQSRGHTGQSRGHSGQSRGHSGHPSLKCKYM